MSQKDMASTKAWIEIVEYKREFKVFGKMEILKEKSKYFSLTFVYG